MTYVVVAIIVVTWFSSLLWLIVKVVDDGGPAALWRLMLAALCVVSLAWIFASVDATTAKGPCIRYETGFASTGKTIAPYRYCVERGEWTQ